MRWARYATYKPYEQHVEENIEDIDQFMEEKMREGEFNETMEFEPPNFDQALQNYR